MPTYNVIGLMSGTSLDGLDIAYCRFNYSKQEKWEWDILISETVTYPDSIRNSLKQAKDLSGLKLSLLDVELGQWMGNVVLEFIEAHQMSVDFIASHGHTVFHDPKKYLSVQIGDPNFIHNFTGCAVISDFRSLDVAKGGQGAPLVPVGDLLLFADSDFCVNLGGIANFSFKRNKDEIYAYDICACNILLNEIASLRNLTYDDKGYLASIGSVRKQLLSKWNNFSFLDKKPPKSLGIESIEPEMFDYIDVDRYTVEDMLATAAEHIAEQISRQIKSVKEKGTVLFTGGGALNEFLMERIKVELGESFTLELADQQIVNYKEALIFAFLGVLNVRNEYNTLASVTGAHSNSISGQKLGVI